MVSANPHVFPAAVELRAGTQTLRVVTGGSSTLVDQRVFLTSPDTACPSSVTGLWLPDFAIVLPALQQGDQADAPTTTLTLNDNMMDTLYRACVETNNTYVDAGIIAVTRASLQAAPAGSGSSPIALVADQLAALVFPSSFTSVARIDTYVVIEATVGCTGDISSATVYATGSISPRTGVADTFVAPTPAAGTSVNLRVCVASQSQLLNSSYGFLDGGAVTSNTFTAVSAYAQRNLSGGVVGWPVLSYATLYLVRCAGSSCDASAASRACSLLSPQYPVSESTATSLRPSSGTHLLCQRVTIGSATRVVGSSTTVEVIEPYSMSSKADLNQLRTSVDFDVTISGGPGGSVQLVVQPLSVPCGTEASESQSFALTVGVQRTIAITTITAYQPIHFCAKPNSSSVDAFEVMSGTLHSFASPSYISFPSLHASGSVTVTMPTTVGLQAMLSRALDCRESIDGGALTFVANSSFTFTVPPCGANSDLDVVHFCELPGGIATYRGSLLMMRAGNCTESDNSAAIRPVSAAPGVPIADVGADTRFLDVAGISASPECSSMIAASVVAASGYLPSTEENAAFFVCTSPVGAPSVTFTTLTPTLTVRNFVVAPSMARSPVNVVRSGGDRTVLTLSSSLPPGYAFFSAGTNCVSNLGDAPGMNTSAASAIYSTLSQCGPVSVCWQAAPSVTPLSIARFTSLTTPTVRRESLAIVRGAAFSAAFASDRCSFMVSAGTRTVYLSADQCASVLEGTTTGSDMTTFTTNISSSGLMAGLSTASLCASSSSDDDACFSFNKLRSQRLRSSTLSLFFSQPLDQESLSTTRPLAPPKSSAQSPDRASHRPGKVLSPSKESSSSDMSEEEEEGEGDACCFCCPCKRPENFFALCRTSSQSGSFVATQQAPREPQRLREPSPVLAVRQRASSPLSLPKAEAGSPARPRHGADVNAGSDSRVVLEDLEAVNDDDEPLLSMQSFRRTSIQRVR